MKKTVKAQKPGAAASRRAQARRPDGVRRDVISREVLNKAAELFATKGISATSLQDISDSVGISRPALYHYFRNKDAILDKLVRGASKTPLALLDSLEAGADSSAVARIRICARGLVLWVLDPSSHFNLVDRFESELPQMIAKTNREAKRRVLYGMKNLISDAGRRGEIRAVDPHIAAFAIIGMCNWTARWFSPEGRFSAKEIAEMIADLAVGSLRRPLCEASTVNVSGLTAQIRQHLDLIDKLATGEQSQ